MKLRLVVAAVLLLVAVGLPFAAVSNSGAPWGFRGHATVLVDVTGDVQATASEARRAREDVTEDKLAATANLHLDAGDELRVARLSRARLRFPNADVVVGDGGRVVFGDGGLTLGRGWLEVQLPTAGSPSFAVAIDGGVVAVRGAGARATLVSDGRGALRALVQGGSLEAKAAGREALAEDGKLLVVDASGPVVTDRPAGLDVSATCSSGRVTIVAPPSTQLFVAGALTYPDALAGAQSGSTSVDAAGAPAVAVFARDVAGNVARVVATCDAPAPAPARQGQR